MSRYLLPWPLVLLVFVGAGEPKEAEVEFLRTQVSGGTTYFELKLAAPDDLAGLELPSDEAAVLAQPEDGVVRRLGQRPALVPLDGAATVYLQADYPTSERPNTLTFVGRMRGDGKPARLRLDYPVARKAAGTSGLVGDRGRRSLELKPAWDRAEKVDLPKERKGKQPHADDLERAWVAGRLARFAVLGAHSPEGGFHSFAASALARKHRLAEPDAMALGRRGQDTGGLGGLYQLLTGATALTESLALRRVAKPGGTDDGERTIHVKDIKGVTVASHPWRKMMKGKRPAPELLAALVPRDNYYLTVRSLAAFAQAWELVDLWGGNVARPVQLTDRDHRVFRRYEKQLCLPLAELNKTLKPDALHAAALTGSDLSWREGSDVTVLFDSADGEAFLKAHDAFVGRAREEYGKELSEEEDKYRGVSFQSFMTPTHREISLYRCRLGEVVVCSNSPAALFRVIDVWEGEADALFDSLDFQYMRTVFARDPKKEDGFVFLSDAFVRRLVGPATWINARRREEARAAMAAISHAAAYSALDAGKPPPTQGTARRAVGLGLDELDIPGGEPVRWDVARGQAASKSHGTLSFSKPLLELPIGRVTRKERQAYEQFREAYESQWRQYFDPVGMRFTLTPKRAALDTYILPLINSEGYRTLRQTTDDKTVRYDPENRPAGTLAQVMVALPDLAREFIPGVGEQASLHLDDGVNLDAWVDLLIRSEARGVKESDLQEWVNLLCAAPLTLSVAVADEKKLTAFIGEFGNTWLGAASKESKHRGVTIRRSAIDLANAKEPALKREVEKYKVRLPAAYFEATTDNTHHLSLSEAALKRRIDAILDAKKGKGGTVEANAGLMLRSPGGKAGAAVRRYAEWATSNRALAAAASWQALYDSGLVKPADPAAKQERAALRLWGFVPASPDNTGFTSDAKTGEVASERHGSLSVPKVHDALAAGAPLAKLLDQVRGVRAELRFREDGIHTTLTLDLDRR